MIYETVCLVDDARPAWFGNFIAAYRKWEQANGFGINNDFITMPNYLTANSVSLAELKVLETDTITKDGMNTTSCYRFGWETDAEKTMFILKY